MKQYKILMHQETFQKARYYQKALGTHNITAGSYLANNLGEKDIALLSTEEFVELLAQTKRPQIFAESDVYGDGSDWSQTELSILGDISIAVPVTVYDNGRHSFPKVHENPFRATLLYVPGALLRNGRGNTPADWDKVTMDGQIDDYSYYLLYERRLLPAFSYANSAAKLKALITIPGLGCGQFAGKFRGRLGDKLRETLIRFIEHHGERFPNVRAVYYDPYRECNNERHEIGHMSLFVRPLTKGNTGKSQLCQPQDYAEGGDDFSNCELFSFVAWDHVSWPGNDYYLGSRATDDGVKAAATDSMAVMTGVEGIYNSRTYTYDPPPGHINWEDVVLTRRIQIQVKDNLVVLPNKKERT
jgi:hypothetical protein